ncbi:MAG TPA: peptide chain release factor N(5)-glutamine methyltransferase [Candidatus Angelobacter sp.]|nr:peptide chain release factor N(5)-glutamine methyltransferase [Candidatus Angelobacter sp.]
MQLKQAQDSAYKILLENDVPSPRLNAELLLQFVLGRERAYLYAHPERELTTEEQAEYNEVIAQRARGCPTQYITGHQEFWGLDLLVSPAVLIPRPETEHVVETVLELVRDYYAEHQHHTSFGNEDAALCAQIDSGKIRIADVGAGSGCIALALASELTQAEIHGSDISEEALEMARVNAARLGLGSRVLFRRSDLLELYLQQPASLSVATATEGTAALAPALVSGDGQFDFVVSNPPYVGESEWQSVQKQVRDFEPRIAVFCGTDGMNVYKKLVPQARKVLRTGGWLVMEIGYSSQEKVKHLLAADGGWTSVGITPDLQGIPRVVAARKM